MSETDLQSFLDFYSDILYVGPFYQRNLDNTHSTASQKSCHVLQCQMAKFWNCLTSESRKDWRWSFLCMDQSLGWTVYFLRMFFVMTYRRWNGIVSRKLTPSQHKSPCIPTSLQNPSHYPKATLQTLHTSVDDFDKLLFLHTHFQEKYCVEIVNCWKNSFMLLLLFALNV